jgi:hypothetical protein
LKRLHQLGHSLALWFVLPVGSSSIFLNYHYAHHEPTIAALGVLGLTCVAMANAPHAVLHYSSSTVLYPVLYSVHHGITHRVVNVLGCACLLGSNYWSQQTGKHFYDHDHGECERSSDPSR